MSTDVASIMLPVNRGMMDRERDMDPAAAAGPAVVRGMKRGDPEPDAQTTAAASLADLAGAECKRPRIDGTGSVVGDIGQVMETQMIPPQHKPLSLLTVKHCFLSIYLHDVLTRPPSSLPPCHLCKKQK